MTCTRRTTDIKEARLILRALGDLHAENVRVTAHDSWWSKKRKSLCFESPDAVVERIGTTWCVVSLPGYPLFDCVPDCDDGDIKITWTEK